VSDRAPLFVLSPARLTGARGRTILAGASEAPTLAPLAHGGRTALGTVYGAISTLYFRGKLAYARRFGGRTTPQPGHGRSYAGM
jgi:hypothetical protein